MTSTHSAESPLANMVAAVSRQHAPSSSISTPLVLEPALRAPSPTLPGAFRASGQPPVRGDKARGPRQSADQPHPLHLHFDPLHPHPLDACHGVMDRLHQDTVLPRTLAFPPLQRSHSPPPPRHHSHYTPTTATTRGPNQIGSLDDTDASSRNGQRPSQTSSSLTDSQNHHMRSSPPIQPGEQAFPGKLPSFSEFLHTTRTTTPPRTPQRRNGSTDSSPHAPPHFDEVAWADSKRRRVDTLGDIYARGSIDQPFAEPRRMSAIDPALSGYQHAPVPSVYTHRPSPSYPPPHQQAPPMHPHARHQSSPAPQGHIPFAQPSAHAPIAQSAYQPPMGQQSYYHDHQAPSYSSYDRPQDSFYPRPAYSGYDAPYGDIRFQHNVGLDHNAFNRKRRGNLPKEATNLLKDWFAANRQSPYPTEDQKMELCNRTGLSLNQVSNWFINARRRAPQKEQREREANGPEA